MQDQSELIAPAVAIESSNRVIFQLLRGISCQRDGNGRVRGVEGADQLLISRGLQNALAIACGDAALPYQSLNAGVEVCAPTPDLVSSGRGYGDLEEAYTAEVVS